MERGAANRQHDGNGTAAFKVLASDNLLYGPIDLSTLIQWTLDKRILPETWIMRLVDNSWVPAGLLSDLRPCFVRTSGQVEPVVAVTATGEVQPEELRQFSLFAGVTNEQLLSLLGFAEFLTCEPGYVLLRKGQPGDAIFFVLSGSVRARVMIGGEEKLLTTIKAGDFFGELAMFTQSPRSVDIIVAEPSRLLRLTAQAFITMNEEIPSLASPILFAMCRSLASRVADLTVQLSRATAAEHVWS